MVYTIDVSESFDTAASPAAIWLALASPPRWPEALTDLAEAPIAPSGRLKAGAVFHAKAAPAT